MGKPYIICVDDERLVLDSLQEQLKIEFGIDYRIEVAESGREALLLFEELLSEKAVIPLIIADYIMPEIKGDELIKQVRHLNPETVAIFLTGQATLQGVTNAVNQGRIYRFIEKPWCRENLCAAVSAALNYYHNDKLGEVKNRQLWESNRKLQQIISQKTEELSLNYKSLAFINKISDIQQVFEEIAGIINYSLQSIKSGIDLIHQQQDTISEMDPESISMYMKNVMDFYRDISEVFDNMASAFDYSTIQNIVQASKNHPMHEMKNETSFERDQLLKNVGEFAAKTKEIEKNSYQNIDKAVAWDDEEILLFNLDDVLFFTSEEGNTIIVTKKGKYKTRDTLNILENKLSSRGFFRCHRGYLINLKYIHKISPWLGSNYISKLEGVPYEIPISRSRLREIKEMLGI